MIDKSKNNPPDGDFDFSDDFLDDLSDNFGTTDNNDQLNGSADSLDDLNVKPKYQANSQSGLGVTGVAGTPIMAKPAGANKIVGFFMDYGIGLVVIAVVGYFSYKYSIEPFFNRKTSAAKDVGKSIIVPAAMPAAAPASMPMPAAAPAVPAAPAPMLAAAPAPSNMMAALPNQLPAAAPASDIVSNGPSASDFAALQQQVANAASLMQNMSNQVDTKLNNALSTNTAAINDLKQQNQQLLNYTQGVSKQIGLISEQVKKQQLVLNGLVANNISQIGKKDNWSKIKGGDHASGLVLEAMISGRAWLRNEKGEEITVSTGDMLPGYGKIVEINVKSGTVITDSGKVLQQ